MTTRADKSEPISMNAAIAAGQAEIAMNPDMSSMSDTEVELYLQRTMDDRRSLTPTLEIVETTFREPGITVLHAFKTEDSLWRYMADGRKRFEFRWWDVESDDRIHAISLAQMSDYAGPLPRVAFDNKKTGQRLAFEVLSVWFEARAPGFGFMDLGQRLYEFEIYTMPPGVCSDCDHHSFEIIPQCVVHRVLCGSILASGGFCPLPVGHNDHADSRRRHA